MLWLNQRFEDEVNKPKEIITLVIYNNEVLKKGGEFGHFEEYEDSKGNSVASINLNRVK